MDVKSQGKEKKPASRKRNKSGTLDFLKIQRHGKPKKIKREGKGLIYIGKIPHGFYEDQMTDYFNQFGKVISAVVSRSEKTGRSKGYGFVEFEDEEVAKIAAETMNNYLMFNKIIQCRYIPPEERIKHKYRQRTTLGPCPKALNRIANARNKTNFLSKLSPSAQEKITQKKIAQFKKFFEERGINFNFKITSNSGKNLNVSESEKDVNNSKELADIESDQQFGVLEIDSSDADIHFKIPPQVKKVIKKSSSACTISESNDSQTGKEPRQKKLKKTGSKEGQQIKMIEQAKKLTRSLEEKSKMVEKLSGKLSKALTAEKSKSQAKKSETLLSQKRRKMKQAVENAKQLKREEIKMKQKLQKKKKASLRTFAESQSKMKISSVSISYYEI